MKFIFKLGIVAVALALCYVIYSPLGILYLIGGILYLTLSSHVPDSNEDRVKKDDPLFPSTHVATDVSSAWLGAKMDEEEALRKQAEKEPRDQGH